MSLPYGAEYWWPIPNRIKRIFIHMKGLDCGHYHLRDAKKLYEIDCYACLEIINQDPELKTKYEQSKSAIELSLYPNGKCSCGNKLVRRVNKSNGVEFLGCICYPSCKNTFKITP